MTIIASFINTKQNWKQVDFIDFNINNVNSNKTSLVIFPTGIVIFILKDFRIKLIAALLPDINSCEAFSNKYCYNLNSWYYQYGTIDCKNQIEIVHKSEQAGSSVASMNRGYSPMYRFSFGTNICMTIRYLFETWMFLRVDRGSSSKNKINVYSLLIFPLLPRLFLFSRIFGIGF